MQECYWVAIAWCIRWHICL